MEDRTRVWLIFGIAGLGVVIGFLAFWIAVSTFKGSEKPGELIPAILGPLFTLMGTLGGYVAGQQAGAAGKEKAEDRADKAQRRETALREVAPNDVMNQAKQNYPNLFK